MKKLLLAGMLIMCKLAVFSQNNATNQKPEVVSEVHISDTTAFTKVDIESEFPGGIKAWQHYLNKHLRYPAEAVQKKIQGTVVLQFIVCTDGTVCDIKAIRGPEELKQSALDAMKNTPKWTPAMQNGKQVKSYKKQPIVYRLP